MTKPGEAEIAIKRLVSEFVASKGELDTYYQKLLAKEKDLRQLVKERQIGFPTLAKAFEEYEELQDKNIVDFLHYKSQPAVQAGVVVAELGKLKREAERDLKIAQYQIEYYENICPFLVDLKEEVEDITQEDREVLFPYTQDENKDATTLYLSLEEYRKLSMTERNQLALDRYWKRHKSKWHIGKTYERYVGYLYEDDDYDVEYVGIAKGLEDLGRDIIAKKGDEVVIIQCKNWAHYKTIYEKHIFQFFGTVFQYRYANPTHKVKPIFITTIKLSDIAKAFAKELKIEYSQNFKMKKDYPCIKCNVSKVDGQKIYHLPFDQQYDKVKIEKKKGEFYAQTIAEAERAGFRRAFRYHGD